MPEQRHKRKGGKNVFVPPHVDLCFEALVVKREKSQTICCSRETSIHKTSGFTGRLDSKMNLSSEFLNRLASSSVGPFWTIIPFLENSAH